MESCKHRYWAFNIMVSGFYDVTTGPLVWIHTCRKLRKGTVGLLGLAHCSHRCMPALIDNSGQLTVLSGTWSQGEQTLGSSASSNSNKLWPQTSYNDFSWTWQKWERSFANWKGVIKNLDWKLYSLVRTTWIPLAGFGKLVNLSSQSPSYTGWGLSNTWVAEDRTRRETTNLGVGNCWEWFNCLLCCLTRFSPRLMKPLWLQNPSPLIIKACCFQNFDIHIQLSLC